MAARRSVVLPMIAVAVSVALASATGFAMSTSLQHRSAHSMNGQTTAGGDLLRRLVSDPWWLLGVTLGAVAFGLHAIAVSVGTLALVQPIIVSGLVLAVPVRALLDHRRPSRRELRWAGVTGAGLAVFIVAVHPAAGSGGTATAAALVLLTLGAGVAVMMTGLSMRTRSDHTRGVLLGVAAGMLFGLLAGFMKLVLNHLSTYGPTSVLIGWPLWTMVVLGLAGMTYNQRAYQAAPLAASMPVLNVVSVTVAIVFGNLVFAETPAHSTAALLAEGIGLPTAGLGLSRLFRAPDRSNREPMPGRESQEQAHAPAVTR